MAIRFYPPTKVRALGSFHQRAVDNQPECSCYLPSGGSSTAVAHLLRCMPNTPEPVGRQWPTSTEEVHVLLPVVLPQLLLLQRQENGTTFRISSLPAASVPRTDRRTERGWRWNVHLDIVFFFFFYFWLILNASKINIVHYLSEPVGSSISLCP